MNPRKAMDKLFVSRVRIKLLRHFLENPDTPIHLRGSVREIDEEINAVRRELIRLEEVKLIRSDRRGNRKYYLLNQDGPFIQELRGIIYKTFGLGGAIIKRQSKLGDIRFAILTGNYYTGISNMEHPVDLVLIGNPEMDELEKLIKEQEKKEAREINYTVFTPKDFDLRKRRSDSFVIELLVAPKLMLIGTISELVG